MKIIMYHYVRDFKNLKNKGINGLDIKKFISQIKYLKSKYNILNPFEIHEIIKTKKNFKKNDCWLTFDDGYYDHYKYVYPILNDFKINASFFPPVITTKQNDVLDVNKIHFILAKCKKKVEILKFIEKKYNFYKEDNFLDFKTILKKIKFKNRYDDNTTMYIKQLLQSLLPLNIRKKICDQLFKKYVSNDTKSFAKRLYMNLSQIKELLKAGNEIGLHGYNHYWLGRLKKEEQIKEITNSVKFWKKNNVIINEFTMCYPYGNYNQDTLKILRKNNCLIGLSTKVASVPLKNYKAYELPRFDTNDFPQ
tara:strand:+ start:4817 stop:5737 length:921 start_codon:yes stop_codon:yes gene_type:complete